MDILLSLKHSVEPGKLPSPVLAQALALLSQNPVTEDQLSDYVLAHAGPHLLPHLFLVLNQWKRAGWIDYTVRLDGCVIAKIIPIGTGFEFPASALPLTGKYLLSRFAWLRRDSNALILERAFLDAQIQIDQVGAAVLLACFSKPATAQEAIAHAAPLAPKQAAAWIDLFARLQILTPADAPEPPELATWEFHDAAFHWLTRSHSLTRDTGATQRFAGKLEPPPPVKAPMTPHMLELPPAPPPGESRFWDILAARKSIRARPSQPMRLDLLAAFLHRTAGLRRYPAGGAIHELEYYVSVASCDRLAPGLYHYHGAHHNLAALPASEKQVQQLLQAAARAWGHDYPPQILITLAARFGRMAWSYERIAYRTTLLNAGVALQTMYLIATDLGLAPCAFGWGDSSLFARAAALNPLVETSVAEFGLSMVDPASAST